MKRSLILSSVKTLLESIPGAPTVVIDDFSATASRAMDSALQSGHCLALKPVLGSKRLSQAGARVAELADIAVHVRVNPEHLVSGFSTYDLQDSIIAKLCGTLALSAHAGTAAGESSALIPDDLGLLTHALFFHIPVTNL